VGWADLVSNCLYDPTFSPFHLCSPEYPDPSGDCSNAIENTRGKLLDDKTWLATCKGMLGAIMQRGRFVLGYNRDFTLYFTKLVSPCSISILCTKFFLQDGQVEV